MKKWFIRIVGGLLLLICALVLTVFLLDEYDTNVIAKYVRNENLPTIKANWQGTPIDAKGRFVNAEYPYLSKTIDLLKWRLGERPFKTEKENDKERLEILDPTAFLQSDRDGILWLGHASFFIRIGGKSLLLDPVYGNPSLITKYVDAPSPLENLKNVDYILLSHDHRDHTDETTLKQLFRKFPNVEILAGLEMDDLLNDWKTPTNRAQTAGWYQQFQTNSEDLKIYFLPIRHWSRRGLFDMNKRLWGGFIIQSAGKTIYFGGDSGYGSHYKEAAELFPKIDYFLIGIGAYEPRWFMEANHNNPADAIQAFTDAKAETLIPMHYGTFDLSDEPPSQPLKLLKTEAEKAGIADKVKALKIGESIEF
jgi:L-ascorbate metabolism protein UlaG (beta-lactamase superfamily)